MAHAEAKAKQSKAASKTELALSCLTKAQCREAFVRQVKHPSFWTINSHQFYPALQPSDELKAQMLDPAPVPAAPQP